MPGRATPLGEEAGRGAGRSGSQPSGSVPCLLLLAALLEVTLCGLPSRSWAWFQEARSDAERGKVLPKLWPAGALVGSSREPGDPGCGRGSPVRPEGSRCQLGRGQDSPSPRWSPVPPARTLAMENTHQQAAGAML